jgi:selenocysteine-specific elongation factor
LDTPLTLGTAGHIDHGKTSLVAALTGKDTDRLAEEKRRGISIELGYAPLALPSGRRLSVVDVPGHERFVRTMVAGATGIDMYLMAVAADDGVMPQTREHAAVLRGLGIEHGVVAVTKADIADPGAAIDAARELLPSAEAIACSVRTGAGLDELRAALDRVAGTLPGRAGAGGEPVLHIDRAFTVKGAGTVVTGTLWRGAVDRGDELVLLPSGTRARVRAVEVHDEPADRAAAGQRVALNLAGIEVREVGRGDVATSVDSGLAPSFILDVALEDLRVEHGTRVTVHHGTRETPARVAWLGGRFHQLRCEAPLVAATGDRLVLRSIAPPDTLGGGVVLEPHARKHGPSNDVLVRLTRIFRGEPPDDPEPPPPHKGARPLNDSVAKSEPLSEVAIALEERLRAAGHEPPIESELSDAERAELPALRGAGRVVRVGRNLHFHVEELAAIERRVATVIERDGSITLARLRDELATTRKFAQALLEHFDSEKLTRRLPDDSRVLRQRGGSSK